MELALLTPPASAPLWLPNPSGALAATILQELTENVHDGTADAALQRHRTDIRPTLRSPMAQSWPKWPHAATLMHAMRDASTTAQWEDDGDLGPAQRLAAARREAALHLRLHCLQDIVAMLEQHVFEQVPSAWPQFRLLAWTDHCLHTGLNAFHLVSVLLIESRCRAICRAVVCCPHANHVSNRRAGWGQAGSPSSWTLNALHAVSTACRTARHRRRGTSSRGGG